MVQDIVLWQAEFKARIYNFLSLALSFASLMFFTVLYSLFFRFFSGKLPVQNDLHKPEEINIVYIMECKIIFSGFHQQHLVVIHICCKLLRYMQYLM